MQKLYRLPRLLIVIPLIFLAFSQATRAQTIVCLETSLGGDICMELLETEAPNTAQNFLSYVNRGAYDNSFFHRMETAGPVFLQGGRFVGTGPNENLAFFQEVIRSAAIANESSIANSRGTVAMVPDDPDNPDSTTSQFLINITDNPGLDSENGGYTVFARLIGDGLAIAEFVTTFPQVSLGEDGLSAVPVIGQEIPVENSIPVYIRDAYIFDGDLDDFEGDGSGGDSDGDSGGNSGGGSGGDSNGDSGGDTPTPSEGETLFEDAVCVDTNLGEFCMQLFPEDAPLTVENFLNYINDGDYNDTIVHRSVPNFVIQAGGYYSDPLGSPVPKDPAVVNEFERPNLRGTVAMARLGGQINSATSEWFVNVVNNTQLDNVDGGFTVFGEIISGMSVVDAINALPRTNQQNTLGGAFGEMPLSDNDNDGVQADDLVLVHRVYVTDVIVEDDDSDNGGSDGGDGGQTTTATYSPASSSFSMPVRINGELYRIFMFQDPSFPGIQFRANTTTIVSLIDNGQEAATMDIDAGSLVIPSVSVGNKVITDVTFTMTDRDTLRFKLTSYNRP